MALDAVEREVSHAITRAERQRRITQAEGALLFADQLKVLPTMANDPQAILAAATAT